MLSTYTSKAGSFPLAAIRQAISNLVFPEWLEMRDRLTRDANRDALTDLANRRALDRALPAAERDARTSIIVFDLNNFGLINKLRGHESGDWLLVEFAAALRTVAIAYGVGERIFRRGGDEFILLASVESAERIRAGVEETFGSYEIVGAHGASVVVSVSGAIGNTFAEADSLLQARKATQKEDANYAS
ncbi:MAG: GGDEF domain-containing protein [Acidobacteriota bacterium]|nr:GGDEF domain-containing protein [Acidobacteriota bacterium]